MIITPNRALKRARCITVETLGLKGKQVRRDVTGTSMIKVKSRKMKMKMKKMKMEKMKMEKMKMKSGIAVSWHVCMQSH